MRVLGFSKKWPKLQQPQFTTFRFPRKDRDWEVGEHVQVVYHPRGKDREYLFSAEIISKCPRTLDDINDLEACADGFTSATEMRDWFWGTYGNKEAFLKPMNILVLESIESQQKKKLAAEKEEKQFDREITKAGPFGVEK